MQCKLTCIEVSIVVHGQAQVQRHSRVAGPHLQALACKCSMQVAELTFEKK